MHTPLQPHTPSPCPFLGLNDVLYSDELWYGQPREGDFDEAPSAALMSPAHLTSDAGAGR